MAYITMNNFQVAADQREAFEQRWRQRRTHLQDVPGFKSFSLLRARNRMAPSRSCMPAL